MDLPGSQSKQQIDRCSTRLQFCTRNLRGTELSRTSDPAQLTFAPQAPVLKQCRPRGCFSAVPGQSFGLAWLRRRFGLGLHFRSWLLGVDPLNRPVCTVHTAQSTPCPACCSVCSLPTLPTLSTRSLGSCQPTAARSPHPRARSRSSLSPSPFHSIVSSHLRHSTPPTPRHPLFPSRPSTSFSCRLSFVFCGRPVLPLEYYIHSICVFFSLFRVASGTCSLLSALVLRSPIADETRATITANPRGNRSRTPPAVPFDHHRPSRGGGIARKKRRKHLTAGTNRHDFKPSARGLVDRSTLRNTASKLPLGGRQARLRLTTLAHTPISIAEPANALPQKQNTCDRCADGSSAGPPRTPVANRIAPPSDPASSLLGR